MTNPVTQNAGQIPLDAQPFFNADGKTISQPWRSFLRNVSLTIGGTQGGTSLAALTQTVAQQQAEIEDAFARDASSPGFVAIGALVARISFLEKSVASVVPVPARAQQSVIDTVSLQRPMPVLDQLASIQKPTPPMDQLVQVPIPVPGLVTTTAPAAGAAAALPATPAGYKAELIGGVVRHVAFY